MVAAVLILACGMFLLGCKGKPGSTKDIPKTEPNLSEPNIVEPNGAHTSEHSTTTDSDVFEIQGTVVYKNIEGGFFAIDGDDGRKYDPINLPESFKKDGLEVKVTARPRRDARSIHLYGIIIEVVDIAAQ
jgi:hypothetical protein